ncbi:MAG: peptidoglycan-associated lipoprotein Pal [Granulosicoccaceae bacterium]
MKQSTIILSAVLSLLLLSACGSNPKKDDIGEGADGANGVATGTGDTNVTGTETDDLGSIGNRAPLERVIYFDYDKSEIRAEYLDVVAQHGRFLAQNPEGRVRLEGHTDERGAREYNIALGENRSKAIGRMLQLQGVSSAQTRSVSYGEELPVDEGHNNEAWAKNRRVNIIYEVEVPN